MQNLESKIWYKYFPRFNPKGFSFTKTKPKNVSKICEETATTLENFSQKFYGIRKMFLHDKKCNNGFVKKSIISAFRNWHYSGFQ